jgi:hypothetical protein
VVLALAWSSLAEKAAAGWQESLSMVRDANVSIDITSPFDVLPESGVAPFRVKISNRSGATRVWKMEFTSARHAGSQVTTTSTSEVFQVENGRSQVFDVLLPLAPLSYSGYEYRQNEIAVEGFGVHQEHVHPPGPMGPRTPPISPFVLMSDALAPATWELVKTSYGSTGGTLVGSPVNLDELSGDWRVLSGAAQLWLTDEDYSSLTAGQRMSIREWVMHGGQLFFCTQDAANAPRAELGLSKDAELGWLALGRTRLVQWNGKQLDTNIVVQMIRDAPATPIRQVESGYPITPQSHGGLASLQLNVPLLIISIGLFAAVVGPLNLFWFAAGANRHRLFWTTPLISVAASVLLGIFILLSDGMGGTGERAVLMHLLPEEKRAVLFQEQIARTGVLFSRGFSVSEDLVLTPVTLTGRGVPRHSGNLESSVRAFGGDWFASRSVQAHLLQAIVPTRAEIQLLNAKEISDTTPPVILSNIPVPLRELIFMDHNSRYWLGSDIHAGQRSTLRSISAQDASNRGTDILAKVEAGPVINAASARRSEPHSFYAVAEQGPFIETLPAIRWRKQHTIYTGLVTPTP